MDSGYDLIFRNTDEVDGRPVKASEGAIPPGLEGTFLRNGPGLLEIGGRALHFFDAHGVVAALGFKDGQAFLRAKLVDTPLLREERAKGRQTKRRGFTNMPGRWANVMNVVLGNPAMHEAFFWAGKLYATDDPGHFELDPRTLAMVKEERWGLVPKMGKMGPLPRVDPKTGHLIDYWVKQTPFKRDTLTFVELDAALQVVRQAEHKLDLSLGFVHEVAFTEKYFVIPEPPVTLDALAVAAGGKSAYECFRVHRDRGIVIHLVPRDPSSGLKAVAARVPAEAGLECFFHVANAYDDGDQVVLDGCSYAWPHFAQWSAPSLLAERGIPLRPGPDPVLRRFRASPDGSATQQPITEAVEVPRINPAFNGRRYQFAYLVHGAQGETPDPYTWPTHVVKVDVNTGARTDFSAGPHRFASQPVFAARPGATEEDDGWVLVWLLNGQSRECEVVILDARAFEKGPLATLKLGACLPLASHCRFEPQQSIF